jgi:hypothetical protein
MCFNYEYNIRRSNDGVSTWRYLYGMKKKPIGMGGEAVEITWPYTFQNMFIVK